MPGEDGAEDAAEEFFGVGVFEIALCCAGDGGPEGRDEDDVGGALG